jgi:lysyl-tRNA synthetase class 2
MREDILKTKQEKLSRLAGFFETAYPEKTGRTHTVGEALTGFEEFSKKETTLTLAGRVRSFRLMGKIAFAHIEDASGKIQLFLSESILGAELFSLFTDNVESGDFVEASGRLFLTKKEERTLEVSAWRILGKSLRPIPTEFYGLKDEEVLLRQRYLDLLANPETRELFRKKSIFWQTVRQFLVDEGFLEVQTPVLEHVPGGADAEPFVTHHQALDQDFYLRISLELHLKRLLVGGYEKVFEIGRLFRNEGIDREHLQEYDDVEFYWAYADLEDGIELTRKLVRRIVQEVTGGLETTFGDERIHWDGEYPLVDFFTEFEREFGIDLSEEVSVEMLRAKASERGIPYDETAGKGRLIDLLYKKTIRKRQRQPCILVGHPVELSPLAKLDPKNPRRVLRAQLIAVGSELTNSFAELNDPLDQRARFEEQMKLRDLGDAEAQMLDEDFLEALEYGMPPAFGFGMSERLFAILMDRSVRETVIFPPMKAKDSLSVAEPSSEALG